MTPKTADVVNPIVLDAAKKAFDACSADPIAIGNFSRALGAYHFQLHDLPSVGKEVLNEYHRFMERSLRAYNDSSEKLWLGIGQRALDDELERERSNAKRVYTRKLLSTLRIFLDSADDARQEVSEEQEELSDLSDVKEDCLVNPKDQPSLHETFSVFVKEVNDVAVVYDLRYTTTVDELKGMITRGKNNAECLLKHEGKILDSGLLVDHGITRGSTIYALCRIRGGVSVVEAAPCVPVEQEISLPTQTTYSLTVRSLRDEKYTYTVSESTTVDELKEMVASDRDLCVSSLILSCGIKTLTTGSLADLGIGESSVVYFRKLTHRAKNKDVISSQFVHSIPGSRDLSSQDDGVFSLFVKPVHGVARIYSVPRLATVVNLKCLVVDHQYKIDSNELYCNFCHDKVKPHCVSHRVFVQRISRGNGLTRKRHDDIMLVFGTKILTRGLLIDYGITKDSTVYLRYKLRGGVRCRRPITRDRFTQTEKIVDDSDAVITKIEQYSGFVGHYNLSIEDEDEELYLAKVSLCNREMIAVSETMDDYQRFENQRTLFRIFSNFNKEAGGQIQFGIVFDPISEFKNYKSLLTAVRNSPINGIRNCSDTFDILIPHRIFTQHSKEMKWTSRDTGLSESNYGYLYIMRLNDPQISGSFSIRIHTTMRFTSPMPVGLNGTFPFPLIVFDGYQGVYVESPEDVVENVVALMPVLPTTETAIYKLSNSLLFPSDVGDSELPIFIYILWNPFSQNGQYFTPVVMRKSKYLLNDLRAKVPDLVKVIIQRGSTYSYVGKTLDDLETDLSFGSSDFVSERALVSETLPSKPSAIVLPSYPIVKLHQSQVDSIVETCTRSIIKSLHSVDEVESPSSPRKRSNGIVPSSKEYDSCEQVSERIDAMFSLYNSPSDVMLSIVELRNHLKSGELVCINRSCDLVSGLDQSHRWPFIHAIQGPDIVGLYFYVFRDGVLPGIPARQCFRIETFCLGVIECVKHVTGEDALERPSSAHDFDIVGSPKQKI